MKRDRPMTPEELDELKGLKADLRGLRARCIALVGRLARGRRSPARAEVENRLLCILHDCLSPALRDLKSINAAAREQTAKRRRR